MEFSYDETIIELELCVEFVAYLRPAILVFYLYVIIRDYNRVLVFLYQIWTHCSEALWADTYSKVKKRQYYSVILNSRRKVRPNLTLWIIHLVPGRNFQKTKISYLLIPTPTCMYQGVGNRPPEISSIRPKIWVCGLRARRWKYVWLK